MSSHKADEHDEHEAKAAKAPKAKPVVARVVPQTYRCVEGEKRFAITVAGKPKRYVVAANDTDAIAHYAKVERVKDKPEDGDLDVKHLPD